ncbi:MAG: hypothetical protein AB7Y46_10100, partial [Armatimonadota bacterium]
SVVEKYLSDLQRKHKRGEPEIQVDRDCAVVSKRRMRRKRDLTCFGWRGQVHGYGAGWYCEDCRRVMVVQVLARPKEDGMELAGQIIGEMQDHPTDEWITWSTYGLHMEAPERFDLSDQTLMAGLIELKLADRGEQIVALRMGMANIALKGKSLLQWAQSEIRQRHKGIKLSWEETQFRGYPAVAVSGYFRNPLRHFQAFFMHVAGKPYPEVVRGWAWHCEQENRIYYAGALVDEDHLEVAEQVAMRVACPEADAGAKQPEEPIR